MDENDKPKKRKRKQPANKTARNAKIVEMAVGGMTNKEIAAEMGLHRGTVGNILNSEQAKEMIDSARSDLHRALTESVNTFLDALHFRASDMKTAAMVATTILKGLGVLTDKAEVTILKPFIVKRMDGSEVVMGHKPETKGED